MRGEPEAINALVAARAGVRREFPARSDFIYRNPTEVAVTQYHPFQPAGAAHCERCGLPAHAVAHLPVLVERWDDRVFWRPGGGRFATVEAASAFIQEQGDGITYLITDLRDLRSAA